MTTKTLKPTANAVVPPKRTVGIDPAQYEKLKQAAKAERRSAANLLSILLAKHFDKQSEAA